VRERGKRRARGRENFDTPAERVSEIEMSMKIKVSMCASTENELVEVESGRLRADQRESKVDRKGTEKRKEAAEAEEEEEEEEEDDRVWYRFRNGDGDSSAAGELDSESNSVDFCF